jgi:NADH:ubiquinone oxidoreductase subunit F (NADH-binding)
VTQRLLAGPPLEAGAESYAAHRSRLGALPVAAGRGGTIQAIAEAGLLGRGGASFPVARKWSTVAERPRGRAVVLANGAEGEPLGAKDRVLIRSRPHLVIDGALLAADAVGADRIVLYIGEEHVAAHAAVTRALAERAAQDRSAGAPPIQVVSAPATYVAGEESAAVHYVNAGDARPTSVPPRPFERGVDGRPTLVQNVESLAHAALIARFGPGWYLQAGRAETGGTMLITIAGAPGSGVVEVELGTTISEIAERAGVPYAAGSPVLLGGYFGTWVAGDAAWNTPLDPVALRRVGASIGAGIVAFLDPRDCGVRMTARTLDYAAGQSAAQCGPCVFGLRAMADAAARIADLRSHQDDLIRISGWSRLIVGRGACHHPDGAAGLLHSAMRVFDRDFAAHQHHRQCLAPDAGGRAA